MFNILKKFILIITAMIGTILAIGTWTIYESGKQKVDPSVIEGYIQFFLVVLLILIGALAIFALASAKYISSAITGAIDQVNYISDGNYEKKIKRRKVKIIPELNQLYEAIDRMTDEIKSRGDENEKKYRQLIDLTTSTVRFNDEYTYHHSVFVAEHAIGLATQMTEEELGDITFDDLQVAGQLHDIGKISIPTDILNKPGPLSVEEYEIVKQHARKGYELIKNSDLNKNIKDAILYHHERIDGSGYPYKLKGDQIPLIAQILSIADVYDALTSDRPYRKAMTKEEAIVIMLDGKGSFFNPDLVDKFLCFIDYKRFQHVVKNDFKYESRIEKMQEMNLKSKELA